MIRKLASGKYRLYSRKKDPKTGKRRNLGTFDSPQGGGKARAGRAVFQAPLDPRAAFPVCRIRTTMNILVACDSFKDALPADAVCAAIARGLKQSHPHAVVTEMPLSDGGEGLLDVLGRALDLDWIEKQVADPLGRPVMGRYGLSADGITAVVEMARASGLQLLTLEERDPRKTSTFGTGELLADAKARGARHALLAIGGSATNDAGIGAAAALGWRFLDADGKDVPPDGGHYERYRPAGACARAFRKNGSAVRRHQSALWAHGRGLDLWPAERRQRSGPGRTG